MLITGRYHKGSDGFSYLVVGEKPNRRLYTLGSESYGYCDENHSCFGGFMDEKSMDGFDPTDAKVVTFDLSIYGE